MELIDPDGKVQDVWPTVLAVPGLIGGIIFWGARTNRHWTVPIGILLAMPILWVNVFTLLIAVIPLREEAGLTPARAWLLRQRVLPMPEGMADDAPGPRRPKPRTAPQTG